MCQDAWSKLLRQVLSLHAVLHLTWKETFVTPMYIPYISPARGAHEALGLGILCAPLEEVNRDK